MDVCELSRVSSSFQVLGSSHAPFPTPFISCIRPNSQHLDSPPPVPSDPGLHAHPSVSERPPSRHLQYSTTRALGAARNDSGIRQPSQQPSPSPPPSSPCRIQAPRASSLRRTRSSRPRSRRRLQHGPVRVQIRRQHRRGRLNGGALIPSAEGIDGAAVSFNREHDLKVRSFSCNVYLPSHSARGRYSVE